MSNLSFLDRNGPFSKALDCDGRVMGEIKEILVNFGWKGWNEAKGGLDDMEIE